MKFKTLMHGGRYVDVMLLPKGIYYTGVPVLYPHDTTMEAYVEKMKGILSETHFINDDYIENLKKCCFVDCDVHLSIDSSAPVINDEFLADVRVLVDYDYEGEQVDFEDGDWDHKEGHIFNTLKRLDEKLKSIGL